ncbi:MAG TPA: nuclear transport factor 2 family protein [Ktedonobacteraceae bacterium]|nr:nuclear transport factor 2 family protein [Ktedonobacteraceae bacterium]
MNTTTTVKTLITALQAGDMEMAASIMSDDFLISGLTPRPLNKGEFLAFQSELLGAMPDFSYSLDQIQQGNEVTALIQITGTHTGNLSLPLFGLRSIQPTGIAIVLPQVPCEFQVDDGKVVGVRVEQVPGGGLSGLLQQIGSELP